MLLVNIDGTLLPVAVGAGWIAEAELRHDNALGSLHITDEGNPCWRRRSIAPAADISDAPLSTFEWWRQFVERRLLRR
jgi:hypothetical protein